MEEKDILNKAGELFMLYGIKSMTMDEIARQMGISKKTLYQFVSNKNELVEKVVAMRIHQEQECICQMVEPKGNAIDQLMEMTDFVRTNMKCMHPSVIFDMQKYHQDAWKVIQDHKQKFIYETVKTNLAKGIENGLYRENLEPSIIARFYLEMVNTVMDPIQSGFAEMGFEQSEVHEQMMRYHIRGIANEKGRNYLKEKFNTNNI
jgi:AcrR family transcriptional regulator